jgi:uncharacterized protein YndB with AHSA1/START domain
MTTTSLLQCEVEVAAPPATVFSYFTDSSKIIRWVGSKATLEPRPGGLYLVDVLDDHISRGTYREVTPVSRLVFSWGWEGDDEIPPGSSMVEIDLVPHGGGTLVKLTHRDLPESAIASHGEGWRHYLDRLALVVAGRDPGPDPWRISPPAENRVSRRARS